MGFLDRFRRQPPAAEQPPGDPRRDLAGLVTEIVGSGFLSRSEAERLVVELVEDDPEGYPTLSADDAVAVLGEVWDGLARAQGAWSDEGDYDRLRQAFAELESDGVLTRMHFACCNTCGHAEIRDERSGDGSWGYTFFHEQDAERLHPGGSELFLAFGSFRPVRGLDPALVERARGGDEEARLDVVARSEVAVGTRVVAALRRHGLRVDWDGTSDRRIRVVDVDWRKRLPVD